MKNINYDLLLLIVFIWLLCLSFSIRVSDEFNGKIDELDSKIDDLDDRLNSLEDKSSADDPYPK